MINSETFSIQKYNKSTNIDLNASSSSDPCKQYVASPIFIFNDKPNNYLCLCLFLS